MLDRSDPHRAARRSRVTPEAKAIFARAMALRPRYDDCISGKRCHSTSLNRHCAVCHDYLELSRALDRLLAQSPWETSPFCADDPDPPEAIAGDSLKAADWRKAWALRCELLEP